MSLVNDTTNWVTLHNDPAGGTEVLVEGATKAKHNVALNKLLSTNTDIDLKNCQILRVTKVLTPEVKSQVSF